MTEQTPTPRYVKLTARITPPGKTHIRNGHGYTLCNWRIGPDAIDTTEPGEMCQQCAAISQAQASNEGIPF